MDDATTEVTTEEWISGESLELSVMDPHDLVVQVLSDDFALPYCPCGWVGATFWPHDDEQRELATTAYRGHLSEEEK